MPSDYHILLIDNDEDDHYFFKEATNQIPGKKIRLTSIYDCPAALTYLRQNPAPDFIVLDLHMPSNSNNTDGITCLKEIKKAEGWKDKPVYIFSQIDKQDIMDVCMKLGATGYWNKGTTIQEIQTVILDMVDRYDAKAVR